MTRQSTPTSSTPARNDSKSAARIPDKPRDCGPHVDTWPILDTEAGDARASQSSNEGKSRKA
jgi:hypothetical protein